jgi:hypothetical protein
MDPITTILMALVAGAAGTAEQVVKDAYDGIKALIKRKYARVSVDTLEGDPASEARKNVVREDLQKAKAGEDAELLVQAKAVLDAVRQHAPEAAASVGVSIQDLEAGSVYVEDITVSSGMGVSIRQAKVVGEVKIVGVHAEDDGTKT